MDDDTRRLIILLAIFAAATGIARVRIVQSCVSCSKGSSSIERPPPAVRDGEGAVSVVVREPPPVVPLGPAESGAVPENEPAQKSGAHWICGVEILPVAIPVAFAPVHVTVGREVLHASVPKALAHDAATPLAPV